MPGPASVEIAADPFVNLPGVLPPSQWDRMVAKLEAAPWSAIDTEFAGWTNRAWDMTYDIRERSPAGRVRVFLWSVALPSGTYDARGEGAVGCVLPASALSHPGIRRWLAGERIKVAHNSPAEYHSLGCHGVEVGGLVNSLSFARYLLPGRQSYSLDSLGHDLFGEGKTADFESFFVEQRESIETVTKEKVVLFKTCRCREEGCKKRKLPEHEKFENHRLEVKTVEKVTPYRYTRTPDEVAAQEPDIVAYSKRDAVLAARLWSHLLTKMDKWTTPSPFAATPPA